MMTEIELRWSGEVMEPIDGLAFIGRNPMDHDNVFIATGDSGNGMTHGTIAGMLITDLIMGKENDVVDFEFRNESRKAEWVRFAHHAAERFVILKLYF